jgi:hypothetical protein
VLKPKLRVFIALCVMTLVAFLHILSTEDDVKEAYALLISMAIFLPLFIIIDTLFEKEILKSQCLRYAFYSLISGATALVFTVLHPSPLFTPCWVKMLFSAFGAVSIPISAVGMMKIAALLRSK